MSISVSVRLADTVEVDVSTDAGYSPDLVSDLCARARETAVLAWDALDTLDAEDSEP